MMAYGIDLAAVEFIDRRTIAAMNRFRGYGLEEEPTLFLEADGSEANAEESTRLALSVCAEHGGREIRLASGQNPWEVRHWTTRSIRATHPGAEIVRTDLAVPISRLPEVVDESYRCGDEAGRLALRVRTRRARHPPRAHRRAAARRAALAGRGAGEGPNPALRAGVGGTVSGEHGLGCGNREYAALEHGESLTLMKQIKSIFDPHGILNPGKIWE